MKKFTQEELDQILAAHKLWLESSRKRGKRADLQGVNLRGVHLQGANLYGVNLRGADLRKTNLYRANLAGANLQEANLEGANLSEVNLGWSNLRRAIVPLSIRDCDTFQRAKFSAEALPWLILHPKWPEWQDRVQILEEQAIMAS